MNRVTAHIMYEMSLLVLLVSLIAVFYLAFEDPDAEVRDRLRSLRRPTVQDLKEQELSRPLADRVLKPVLGAIYEAVRRRTPTSVAKNLEQRLQRAGIQMDAGRFLGAKIMSATLGASLGLLIATAANVGGMEVSLLTGCLGVSGFILPDVWVSRRCSSRQMRFRKMLPDALDLLCVSVEAGLGFDGAVQKVSEKFPPPLSEEFSYFLREIRLGSPRPESLRRLADRVAIPEMQTFCAAVIQADQLGVSISRVLRVQSDQMRVTRKQRAEEQAMKAPVKMLFPLVFFIFPTIFIVILGPVMLNFMQIWRH